MQHHLHYTHDELIEYIMIKVEQSAKTIDEGIKNLMANLNKIITECLHVTVT